MRLKWFDILIILINVFFDMKKSLKIIAIVWKVLKMLCGFTEVIEKGHQDNDDEVKSNKK